jgi:hypothetical protein
MASGCRWTIAWLLLVLGTVQSSGCTDGADAVKFEIMDEAGGTAFSGVVPRLRPDNEPIDTLVAVRKLRHPDLGLVTSLAVASNWLVATDQFLAPHIVVLNLEEGRTHATFGRHGDGPGEFRDPATVLIANAEPLDVWVHDFSFGRFSTV